MLRLGAGSAILLLSLSLVMAAPGELPAQQRPSQEELRRLSRELWEAQIRRDGRVTDARRNATVRKIMTRLGNAVAQPGLTLNWAIVNNDTVNAWATPGGYIAVFRGLMDLADSVSQQEFPRDTSAAARRSASFVAAVLAHELSHVTLGHGGDPQISNCMDRMNSEGGVTLNETGQRNVEAEARLIKNSVECMHYSQGQELAADHLGAFYLLRENWRGASDWSIQSMIDFFTAMDRMDRQKSYFFSPYLTSYLSSHPRNSTRIAELETYRARLKLNQTRFDDALSFIANNMELDLAVALLDSVLTDFPDLIAAKQARASAFQRKYLNTVPVQMQKVRASVPTIRAVFIEDIRGEDMGDEALRSEARRQLTALLPLDDSPATLSSLAILDAYAGDASQAEQRARTALAKDPGNPELLNNLGVVLFLAGRYADARDQFKASLDASGDQGPIWVVLPVFFNYGRSLIVLEDANGRVIMERYLQNDDKSEWAREARRLLGRDQPARPAKKQDTARPASKNNEVGFGASRADVIAAWGQPDNVETSDGLEFLRYRTGRQVIIHPDKGVAAFIYSTREAGVLDGVQVGDPLTRLTNRRRPAEVHDDVYFFPGEGTITIVKVADGNIVQLALALPD